MANLFAQFLRENSYENVIVRDTPSLPPHQKEKFEERFRRNRQRPIAITVKTVP